MSDYGFGSLVTGFLVLLAFLPLALWKLVEIVIWLVTNVRVTW